MKKLIYLLICLSLILTTSLTLLSCADNSGARDNQNDPDTTTSKDENDEPVLEAEPMRIEEGYAVISQSDFKIKVTEDEKTTLRAARIATLKNVDGEHAVYIDVLDDELKVKVFKIFRGRAVVELYREDTLAVVLVNVTFDKKLVMSTNFYKVSDQQQMTDGSYREVENVGFLKIGDVNGASFNGSVADSSAIRGCEMGVAVFFNKTINNVSEAKALKNDSSCILLADSISATDGKNTYSDTEKVASLFDFDNDEFIRTKLNFDYVLSMYSLSR